MSRVQLAKLVPCSRGAIIAWEKELEALRHESSEETKRALEWYRQHPPLPAWATPECRERVFVNLRAENAPVVTSGAFRAWVTPALCFAFGPAFVVDDPQDGVPDDELVRVLLRFGGWRDATGVWRVSTGPWSAP